MSSLSSSSSPSTFTAAQVRKYGAVSDVLELGEHRVPSSDSLGATDVLIRVHSAGVNPIDWKIIKGYMHSIFPTSFPHIPGIDCAGEVVALGKNCHRFKVGDRVLAQATSTFAEYAVTGEHLTALLPSSLSYSQGAAIPIASLTSYNILFNHIQLKASDKVLILGGSSGTGLFAIQFAKNVVGAFVATTASAKNHELIKTLSGKSPDVIVDYTTEDWSESLKNSGVNIIYDCIGDPKDFERAKRILKSTDRFYSIANFVPKDVKEFQFQSIHGSPKEDAGKRLETIINWIQSNKAKVIIDKVFPFTKQGVIQALTESEAQRTRGKIVIEIKAPKVPTNTLAKI